MIEELLDTWSIHDRINQYLLSAISPDGLLSVSASRGRSVGEQFAHMHNVRLMWVKQAAPTLLDGLEMIEKHTAADHDLLRHSLERSGTAIRTLLQEAMGGEGKIKGFRPHAVAFLGYLISHESHHRGQIALSLKQGGHPLDKDLFRHVGVGGTLRWQATRLHQIRLYSRVRAHGRRRARLQCDSGEPYHGSTHYVVQRSGPSAGPQLEDRDTVRSGRSGQSGRCACVCLRPGLASSWACRAPPVRGKDRVHLAIPR